MYVCVYIHIYVLNAIMITIRTSSHVIFVLLPLAGRLTVTKWSRACCAAHAGWARCRYIRLINISIIHTITHITQLSIYDMSAPRMRAGLIL